MIGHNKVLQQKQVRTTHKVLHKRILLGTAGKYSKRILCTWCNKKVLRDTGCRQSRQVRAVHPRPNSVTRWKS